MFAQFTAQIEHVQSKLKATAQVKYVAVLLDDKQAPAMLVTMNLQDNEMQIQRLNAVTEGREDSMQLWALSDGWFDASGLAERIATSPAPPVWPSVSKTKAA